MILFPLFGMKRSKKRLKFRGRDLNYHRRAPCVHQLASADSSWKGDCCGG